MALTRSSIWSVVSCMNTHGSLSSTAIMITNLFIGTPTLFSVTEISKTSFSVLFYVQINGGYIHMNIIENVYFPILSCKSSYSIEATIQSRTKLLRTISSTVNSILVCDCINLAISKNLPNPDMSVLFLFISVCL